MDRDGLQLEAHDVEALGIVDQPEAALGRNQLGDRGEIAPRVRGGEDPPRRPEPKGLDLRGQGLAVVDHVLGPERTHPLLRLGARRGGDDLELRPRTQELGCDRAHATGSADEQECGGCPGYGNVHAQAIEEHLPRRQGREGQGRRLCAGEARRLPPHDALVDQMELGVRPLPIERAGVPDRVSFGEASDVLTDRNDLSHRIPTQHFRRIALGPLGLADLEVDGIDGDGMHLHEQVVTRGTRRLQLDIEQRIVPVDRTGFRVAHCLHVPAPDPAD